MTKGFLPISKKEMEKYLTINLKGTKPNNMPRYSKKRTSTSSPYRGISHHKICVVSSIDENDNLLLQITGLGRCTTQMLENSLGNKLKNAESINADSASAYQEFCLKHNLDLYAVPSGFHSNGQINIAEINGGFTGNQTDLNFNQALTCNMYQVVRASLNTADCTAVHVGDISASRYARVNIDLEHAGHTVLAPYMEYFFGNILGG